MSTLEDKSKLISDFEKYYKSNKKMDIEFYNECKKICESYNIKELIHAKYVLEGEKIDATGNNVGITYVFSIASLSVAILSLLAKSIMQVLSTNSYIELFSYICIFVMCLIAVLFVVYMATIPSRRRNSYYYSIICDEIEKRYKMDQNI